MYTPTQNYGLAMPSYGDEADIGVINDMVTAQVDELLFQNRTISAPPFETTEAYTEGDLVVYENVLYRFTANKAAGAWDSSKVVQTSLAAEIESKGSGGASSLSDLTDTDIDTPVVGDVLTWDGTAWVNAEGTPTVTKTASGNPIEITDGAAAPLVKCVTEIQGSQDLHGYDKPWVGGTGKNKANIAENTTLPMSTSNYRIYHQEEDTALGQMVIISFFFENAVYSSNAGALVNMQSKDGTPHYYTPPQFGMTSNTPLNGIYTFVSQSTVNFNDVFVYLGNSYAQFSSGKASVMLQIGSDATTPTSFIPYENICPITAYTEGEIEVSDGDGNVTTHTTTYPSAIYRGSEDVVKGEVTSNYKKKVLTGSENWEFLNQSLYPTTFVLSDNSLDVVDIAENGVCDAYLYKYYAAAERPDGVVSIYASTSKRIVVRDDRFTTVEDFKTWLSNNNVTIYYQALNPTTSSVTPTNLPIKSLSGYNHIESSTGDMEVEYITQGYQPLVDLIDEAAEQREAYSTDEQEIGTWVDGSKLYQKTYTFSGTGAANPYSTTVDMTGKTVTNVIPHYAKYTYGGGTVGYCVGSRLTANNSNVLTVQYNDEAPPTLDVIANLGGSTETYEVCFTLQYVKTSSNNRSLSKGATDSLRAEISGVKGEGEELTETDEKAVKKAQSESIETKEEADETEESADEVQNETVTE